MIRTGKVVQSSNDSIQVCFMRPEMCAQCGACVGHQAHEETVQVHGKADVGDLVEVEMPDAQIVKVSVIAYIIPLAGLLLGLLGGQTMLKSDLWAAVFGVAGLGIGLLIVRLFDRRLGARSEWQPHLIAVRKPEQITTDGGENHE